MKAGNLPSVGSEKTVVVKDFSDSKVEIAAITEEKPDSSLKNILENFGGQLVD